MAVLFRCLIAAALAAASHAQVRQGPAVSWPPAVSDGLTSSFPLSGSASGGYSQSQFAFGFIAAAGRQLSKVHVQISGVTGTVGSSDFCAALAADNSAKPGSDIENRCTTDASVTAAGTVSVNGFTSTSTVTAGTAYHVVVRNANATPASNYWTILALVLNADSHGSFSNSNAGTMGGIAYNSTTDGGSTWSKALRTACVMLEWTDGTLEGWPCANVTSTATQIYADREGGIKFLTGNFVMKAVGAGCWMSKTSTPSAAVRFNVYAGASTTAASRPLLASTYWVAANLVSSSRAHSISFFSSPVVIPANNWITVAADEDSNADSSSARYNVSTVQLMNSYAQYWWRWSGTSPLSTYRTTTSGDWTDTDKEFATCYLILDPATPFLFPSGGFATVQ